MRGVTLLHAVKVLSNYKYEAQPEQEISTWKTTEIYTKKITRVTFI